MKQGKVRIKKITIRNFKNVRNGQITLKHNIHDNQASVLGLYGQNGSGKSALIDVIMLLKLALCGKKIPSHYADAINVESESASFLFELSVELPKEERSYDVTYAFKLKKEQDHNGNESFVADDENCKASISDEVLSYCIHGDKQMTQLINTDTKDVFGPKHTYKEIIGDDQETIMNLLVDKRYTYLDSRSFVFSRELLDVIYKNCHSALYLSLIEKLVYYGRYELFVVHSGLDALNNIYFNFGDSDYVILSFDKPHTLSKDMLDQSVQAISNMNEVLKEIIPHFTIDLINLGPELLKSGETGYRVQLMSKRNNQEIPLRNESEGIKKIVSIIALLIGIYNNSSLTVAIDDIDSHLFEYLFGELLKILSEEGKGQLIFTSHNLRPLEILDHNFIAFTTTDPENRYVRMTDIKEKDNLRDFYYRSSLLGNQKVRLYEPTNNYKISLALRKANMI